MRFTLSSKCLCFVFFVSICAFIPSQSFAIFSAAGNPTYGNSWSFEFAATPEDDTEFFNQIGIFMHGLDTLAPDHDHILFGFSSNFGFFDETTWGQDYVSDDRQTAAATGDLVDSSFDFYDTLEFSIWFDGQPTTDLSFDLVAWESGNQKFVNTVTYTPWIDLNLDIPSTSDFIFSSSSQTYDYPENAPVPEPTTMLLFGIGLIGLISFGRKKLKKNI